MPLVVVVRRRRSGFRAGRPPRNKGVRSIPADPPTVEEIVAVIHDAGDSAHGRRAARPDRVVRWRAGLRVKDAAQAALKELRGELGRGSRELLHDVNVTLRDARKNLRRVSRQLVKDLEAVQHAAAGERPGAQATKATRRSSSRGATTAAKRARGT